jgi:hypothetical protein
LFAYPITYYTYGNRDFSTTKGITMAYELRRLGNIRMNIAYTLQFAAGTGSSSTSANGGSNGQVSAEGLLQTFISSGQPNMRYSTALDYDSRHMIRVNVDYRYDEGQGPIVMGKHIFQNAGINLLLRASSGEPYTRFAEANESGNKGVVSGGINTAQLPWHYGADLRIDKDFVLMMGKKKAPGVHGKMSKPLAINAYVSILNVFNIRDVLGVYGYTGRPDDNGFLSSAIGVSKISQQTNPTSYAMLYALAYNNPGNINLPRRVNVGLTLNF